MSDKMNRFQIETTMSVPDRRGHSYTAGLALRKIVAMVTGSDDKRPKFEKNGDCFKVFAGPSSCPILFELSPPGTFGDQLPKHWRLVASSSVESEAQLGEVLKAIVLLLVRF
jgi:hypothetical protein